MIFPIEPVSFERCRSRTLPFQVKSALAAIGVPSPPIVVSRVNTAACAVPSANASANPTMYRARRIEGMDRMDTMRIPKQGAIPAPDVHDYVGQLFHRRPRRYSRVIDADMHKAKVLLRATACGRQAVRARRSIASRLY